MTMEIDNEHRNKLVDVLALILTQLCEQNDRFIMNHNINVTRFHTPQAPQITIKFYLKRIAKYSLCSEECLVLALIYIDRLRSNENFLVNSFNVHRVMLISVMLGAKFFDDEYFNNANFGKVGGVSCKEINLLELEFLFMVNFNLCVETNLFQMYHDRLLSYAQPQGREQDISASQAESGKQGGASPKRALAPQPVESMQQDTDMKSPNASRALIR